MKPYPSVSIVIPAFNAQKYLAAAIESVLVQNHRSLEIIVVDDGSTDATADIARAFGPAVTVINQTNKGPAAARNAGLAAAQGEYIGFLDSDDVYKPGSIGIQLARFAKNPGVEIVLGRVAREKLVSPPGAPPVFEPMHLEKDQVSNAFGVGLYKRSVFDRVGNLEESLRHCEDWDWFTRARELRTPMLLHDTVVLCQRLHHNNLTRDVEAGNRYMALSIKRSLDRRRAAHGRVLPLPNFADFAEKSQ